MIGKVQQDSFPSLRIRIDEYDQYEPSLSSGYGSPVSPGESLLPRDCHETFNGFLAKSSGLQTSSPTSPNSNSNKLTSSQACDQQQQQQTPSSRYKTEMCRPYQEHGECKYGEKCQFAHGTDELRTVNRHPKYKTDMCRTYHSVGFCPYGPRCHFIHALDELRPAPASPDRKTAANNSNTPIKQLPMFGGGNGGGGSDNSQRSGGPLSINTTWSFPDTMQSDMKSAVNQLNNFFNVSVGGSSASQRNNIINNSNNLNSSSSSRSSDSSRSGSFCSDLDSPSSTSPPPSSAYSPAQPRLPIFSRLA